MVKTNYVRILIVLIGMAGSGVGAKAQVVDQVVAKIPHEFLVDGKTFPAGSYKVERENTSDDRELLIRNVDTSESAILVPTVVESTPSDHSTLSFERVGDELLLSRIETAEHIFTIRVPRSEIMEAEAKSQHDGTSNSGGAAGSK